MSNKSPFFSMNEPLHFSDYGFEPQIDYFQVLEEAMRQEKESSSRSIDSLRFKLQKPKTKDKQFSRKNYNFKAKTTKKRSWWKNALFFFKWKKWGGGGGGLDLELEPDVHQARARAFRASISGTVYLTESSRYLNPSSGPLETPYLSLRELNMEYQQRVSTSAMPTYLAT